MNKLNFKERIENIKEEEITTLKDTLLVYNYKYKFNNDGSCDVPTILVNLNPIENIIVSVVVTEIEMDNDFNITIHGSCEEFGDIDFKAKDSFPGEIETILECIYMNE